MFLPAPRKFMKIILDDSDFAPLFRTSYHQISISSWKPLNTIVTSSSISFLMNTAPRIILSPVDLKIEWHIQMEMLKVCLIAWHRLFDVLWIRYKTAIFIRSQSRIKQLIDVVEQARVCDISRRHDTSSGGINLFINLFFSGRAKR